MDPVTMGLEPREKLRRARSVMDWSQDKCDRVAGVKTGRTYSYERGKANPPREFMAPLADAWGIPIDWFYDGADDFPPAIGGRTIQAPEPAGVPIRGDLPAREGRQPGGAVATVRPNVTFPLPPNAEYRRIGDDGLAPTLRKGDLVLVIPDDHARRDTLALVQFPDGVIDVYLVGRGRGDGRLEPLGQDQPEAPEEGWRILGYLVEVRRTLAGGLVVSFECESGLSRDMLAL